jgi:hypothetical protein
MTTITQHFTSSQSLFMVLDGNGRRVFSGERVELQLIYRFVHCSFSVKQNKTKIARPTDFL